MTWTTLLPLEKKNMAAIHHHLTQAHTKYQEILSHVELYLRLLGMLLQNSSIANQCLMQGRSHLADRCCELVQALTQFSVSFLYALFFIDSCPYFPSFPHSSQSQMRAICSILHKLYKIAIPHLFIEICPEIKTSKPSTYSCISNRPVSIADLHYQLRETIAPAL
jgi:hypothetical protein